MHPLLQIDAQNLVYIRCLMKIRVLNTTSACMDKRLQIYVLMVCSTIQFLETVTWNRPRCAFWEHALLIILEHWHLCRATKIAQSNSHFILNRLINMNWIQIVLLATTRAFVELLRKWAVRKDYCITLSKRLVILLNVWHVLYGIMLTM